jgi:hypothetical protein
VMIRLAAFMLSPVHKGILSNTVSGFVDSSPIPRVRKIRTAVGRVQQEAVTTGCIILRLIGMVKGAH